MKSLTMTSAAAAAIGLASLGWTTRSFAEDTMPAPTQAEAEVKTTTSPPNVPLLASGLFVLAGSYVPSVLVAAANNRSYDNNLYIPVVGPWMNLAARPACGGLGQTSCSTEGGFKALLIIDGIAQAIGAVGTIAGLVSPQTRTTAIARTAQADKKPQALKVRFIPASVGKSAYGMAAIGTF
jgi:hypothetical protein